MYPAPNLNIGKLPGTISIAIRNTLNNTSGHRNWRNLLEVARKDYFYSQDQVDIFDNQAQHGGPASVVLNDLGGRGCTVRQLTSYLNELGLEKLVLKLKEKEPVRILKEPESSCTVFEGECLSISVSATGLPYPSYLWIHCSDGTKLNRLEEQKFATLNIPKVRLHHAGHYCCQIQNGNPDEVTHSKYCKVEVKTNPAALYEDQPPKIIVQPQNITVTYGGVAKFRCEVKGGHNQVYHQWYKDGNPLPGADGKEFEIKICDNKLYEGYYYCEIITSCEKLMSHCANLKIVIPEDQQFRATDKVALLIGNSEYMNAKRLHAPENDIKKLTKTLKKMDFKVMSLLNVTLTEMKSLIDEFCRLLGNGVYGFFYYCGHGFEEYSKQYLVPFDAPAGYLQNQCLCLREVVTKIAKTDPALICVVLDMCRDRNDVPGDAPCRDEVLDKSHIRPNQIFLFATTNGLKAHETYTQSNLMKVLPDEISKMQSVETAFSNIKRAFNTMEELNTGTCQYPECRSNLNENRCLTDPIHSAGHTQEFNSRQIEWAKMCMKPDRQRLELEQFGIKINLDFQDATSNILIVYVSVQQDETKTSDCIAYICKVQDVEQKKKTIAKGKTQTIIPDLQRLRDDLMITIRVDFQTIEGSGETKYVLRNLGQPLCSKLRLYQPKN